MGLFVRTDNLSALLKKIETEATLDPAELDVSLTSIAGQPEFQLGKNAWMFGHGQKKVRDFAAGRLLETKTGDRIDSGLVDLVIKEMPGKPSNIRAEMARLVASTGPDRIQARLGHMVHSADAADKEAALDLIDVHPRWQDLIGYLKVTIRDHESRIRQRTARILARGLENCAILFILRELIHDEDETLRHIIIEAFAQKPNAEIVEPFFERLTLEGPEARAIMVRALSHLARNAQSQIEDRLLPMLGDENPAVRDIAVKLLGEMPDRTRVLKAFLVHCRGIACWLRDRSMQSLQKISDSLLEPLLTLMQDPDDDIRVAAMVMAGGSRDPRLVPLVKAILLGKADWWIRSMAADVLGKFPGAGVTETLISQIQDPDLRYSVISVLGSRGGPAELSALLECLQDPQRGIRAAVVVALKDSRTPEAMNMIGRIARNDIDDEVREKAIEVLQGFGDMSRAIIEELEVRKFQAERKLAAAPLELSMANESLNRDESLSR